MHAGVLAGRRDQLNRGGQPVLRGAAGQRQRRPAERVEGVGEADDRVANLEVALEGGRRHEGKRGREQQIDPLHRRGRPFAVLVAAAPRRLELGVGHLIAALELGAHVRAVGVRARGKQLAVRLGHLAQEHAVHPLGQREVDRPPAREALRRRLHARPHERLGAVEPRHTQLELLERAELGPLEARRERLEHAHAAVGVARHRPRVIEARGEREAALERHEPVARLEAHHPTARRRDADRAARVRAERGVGEAGRERRAATRARPARRTARRERIGHVAEVRVPARDAVGELVQVRLAHVRVAGRLEPGHGLGAALGHVVGEQDRAVGRRQPGGVEQVLDRERDSLGDLLWAGKEDSPY